MEKKAESSNEKNALVWLRRDLRLYDHAALHQALTSSTNVVCVFIFDTTIRKTKSTQPLPSDTDYRNLAERRGEAENRVGNA